MYYLDETGARYNVLFGKYEKENRCRPSKRARWPGNRHFLEENGASNRMQTFSTFFFTEVGEGAQNQEVLRIE